MISPCARTCLAASLLASAAAFAAACGGEAANAPPLAATAGRDAAGGSTAGSGGTAGSATGGAPGGGGASNAGAAGSAAAAGNAATAGAAGDHGTSGTAGAAGTGDDDEDPGDPDEPGDGPAEELPPEEPPTPNEPNDPDPTSRVITIATWNANYNNTVAAVVAHIKQIDADVIGLQEMGNVGHATAILDGVTECPKCAYARYFPKEHNAHACPILYKKAKFKRLDEGSFKVNDAKVIEDGGSRQNLLEKATVWVKLEDLETQARFFVSNNHLVPSVEKDGKPFPGREERLAMFAEHMDGIVKTIDKAQDQELPIFITGDFNVNYRKDKQAQSPVFPYARFKAKNVFANWYYLGAKANEGTHDTGTRLIDYVHASKSKLVEPKAYAILPKGNSDHNPVRLTLRLRRAAPKQP